NSTGTYTFQKKNVKDQALTVDVGQLGMLKVDVGLGLVDLDKFPQAQVNLRYKSAALGRTLQRDFLLTKDSASSVWNEVILEEPTSGYEYKVDWLRKADNKIIEGAWTGSNEQQLRLRGPISDRLDVKVLCTGKFGADADAIIEVPVSLRYNDTANHYMQDGALVFTQDNQQLDWTIDIIDAQNQDYEYQY